MKSDTEFDIIVHGATGFTGRLVAEHLQARYGHDGAVQWAMSGRSLAKLERNRIEPARKQDSRAAGLGNRVI